MDGSWELQSDVQVVILSFNNRESHYRERIPKIQKWKIPWVLSFASSHDQRSVEKVYKEKKIETEHFVSFLRTKEITKFSIT